MQTGILLHQMLERVSFGANVNQFQNIALPLIQGTAYEPWLDIFAQILEDGFYTPLQKGGFCLADIDRHSVFQEMDFIFQQEKAEAQLPKGFAIGAVDLVVLHEGKIYIIDWKSNYLGPSSESYQKDNLHRCMVEHQYDLQAKIYAKAAMRYIALSQAPWEFGGAFYLFLRGLRKGSDSGILHLNGESLC